MALIDNGGPAFPSHGSMGEVVQEGMTLRDYFAALAMQAIITYPGEDIDTFVERADFAYSQADAMLAARKIGS